MRLVKLSRALVIATGLTACTGGLTSEPGGDGPNPTNTVKVVVKDGSIPATGVQVFFQNADDTVISAEETDATGVASEIMLAGNVTVVRTYPQILPVPEGGNRRPDVYSYVGVVGGDVLEIGKETPAYGTEIETSAIVVKVPDTGENDEYTVRTNCGEGTGTAPNIAITVANCPDMLDVYVMQDDSAFYMKKPFATNVDVSTGILQDALGSTVTALNLPPDTNVDYQQKVMSGSYELLSGNRTNINNPANVTMPTILGVDSLILLTFNGPAGQIMSAKRDVYTGAPSTIDATLPVVPKIENPEEGPMFTPTSATWKESVGTTADGVLFVLSVTPPDPGATGLDRSYTRYIIAPHGATTLRVTAVPDLPEYNPTALDQITHGLALVTATGGYDAFRSKAFSKENFVDATPSGSSLSLSYVGNLALEQ